MLDHGHLVDVAEPGEAIRTLRETLAKRGIALEAGATEAEPDAAPAPGVPQPQWADPPSLTLPAVRLDKPLTITKIRAEYMHDVYVFSSGQTPEVIRANAHSKEIIQENCIHCHEEAVETIMMGAQPFDRYCWDCHRNIAHGPRGASIVPYQDSNFYAVKKVKVTVT